MTKFKTPKVQRTVNFQVGKSNKLVDQERRALPPGVRISKNGNVYMETRKNRSDALGKRL